MTREHHLIIFGYCHTSQEHLYGHLRSGECNFSQAIEYEQISHLRLLPLFFLWHIQRLPYINKIHQLRYFTMVRRSYLFNFTLF